MALKNKTLSTVILASAGYQGVRMLGIIPDNPARGILTVASNIGLLAGGIWLALRVRK